MLLAAFAWRALPGSLFAVQSDREVCLVEGEILLHAFSSGLVHMPMPGLISSLMFQHSPFLSPEHWRLAAGVLAFILLMAAAGISGGPRRALAATALLQIAIAINGPGPGSCAWFGGGAGYYFALYWLFVILVAGVCAWREEFPSPRRSLILGMAVGVSLLYRSTLVFFPLILALLELSARGRRAWRSVALLLVVPYLFLAPWIVMNWVTEHRFIPLERGEADTVVIEGALGFVRKVGWSISLPRPLDGGDGSSSALTWAFSEVLAHPLRYARGCLLRARFIFSLQPLLALAALLGLWFDRRRPQTRAVAALGIYYALIHCFLALDPEYFEPLWPLLALMAAGLVPAGPARSSARDAFVRACRVVLHVWLSAALALAFYTMGTVAVYGRARSAGDAGLDSAIARNPEDDWLRFERGRQRLFSGELPGAVADLAEAVSARPADARRRVLLAWARLLQGEREPFLAQASSPGPLQFDEAVIIAHGFLILGLQAPAEEHLAHALRFARPQGSDRDDPDALEIHCGEIIAAVRRLLGTRPDQELSRVYTMIEKLTGGCKPGAKSSTRSRPSWNEADATFLVHQQAMRFQALGQYDRAIELLDRLIGSNQGSARLYSDRGVCEYLRGQERRAISDLEDSLRLDASWSGAVLSLASIHIAHGRTAQAAALYEQALKTKPRDRLIIAARAELASRLQTRSGGQR